MTPVHQEFYARYEGEKPGPGVYGDCFRAGLASLLDLPLKAVPHFLKESDGDRANFWYLVNRWLADRGLALILVQGMDFKHETRVGIAPVFHLMLGEDIDGDGHTLIGLNGKIVFDPNPTQPALVTKPEKMVFGLLLNAANWHSGPQG